MKKGSNGLQQAHDEKRRPTNYRDGVYTDGGAVTTGNSGKAETRSGGKGGWLGGSEARNAGDEARF